MNRCPNCAAQNREGAKFCTSCGFKLAPAPPEPAVVVNHERSAFSTTAHLPPSSSRDTVADADAPAEAGETSTEQSFGSWSTEPTADAPELPGPGPSWHADPPKDTAVPVSDEMIETLVGGFPTESWEVEGTPDRADDDVAAGLRSVVETTSDPLAGISPPSIDHLLRIARELEYGLIELAETMPASAAATELPADLDTSGFSGALADLQTDDELQPLRNAVETARQRPRDVDVMLDLVLRADAMATVLRERDRLKATIEAATTGPAPEAADTGSDEMDDEQELDLEEAIEDDSEAGQSTSS